MKPRRIQQPQEFGKVAVVMGGNAAEREVSLRSGAQVLAGLQAGGIDVTAFDSGEQSLLELSQGGFDRVFNIVHGRGGEDGELQGALDSIGLPYTGSGVLGSALGMDKLRTKLCWLGAGMPTPAWRVLEKQADVQACADALGFPLIVKPALEGSSIGMSKVDNLDGLYTAWQQASQYGCAVFAEQWVTGPEYTVALLDGQALPMIRLQTPNAFYDYEAKYQSDSTEYHCPCGLPAEQEQVLQALSVQAFDVLGGSGWGRVDLMLDRDGKPWLLEINTVPGMTDHSLVPMAARAAGIDFNELVWRILETSVGSEGDAA